MGCPAAGGSVLTSGKKLFPRTNIPGRPPEYPGRSGGSEMSLLIGGIVSVILGAIGFSLWWSDFIIIMKGGVPIMLILGGILAVYVGLDAMEDRMREERQKQEEKLEKTREEIEQVKVQAEQYREEIERLKEQAKKNTP
jgi:cell shape-determining protein MreC